MPATHDLVIHGPDATPAHARALQALTGASVVHPRREHAFRLAEVRALDGVAEYCARLALDRALVAHDTSLARFRLVAMDMDSTLITIECIDEIAGFAGKKPEIAAITARAMRGELDFAESLRARVAALAGLPATVLEQVYEERLRLSPGAEVMLARLRTLGVRTLLVSGGFTFFTERLKTRLALDETRANTLEIVDGTLTGRVLGEIVDASGKARTLAQLRERLGATREEVIAIGDGANDIAMLAEAGTSIAYHAKPVVRERATYSFDHVGLDGVLNLFD